MTLRFSTSAAVAALALASTPALASPQVVASIPPVHSLVAGVMEGVGTPTLLVQGGASPHTYAMRPSEARALDEADVVFWVGETIETFLQDPLESVATDAHVVELSAVPGMTLLAVREGGAFDAHDHDHGHGHAEEAADAHGHDDHDHDHDKEAADAHDHDDDHDHAKEAADAHDHDHDHDHDKEAADAHDHDHDHDHDKEAADAHDHDHDHDHAKEAADAHGHDDHGHEAADAHGHDHHDHGTFDAHIWLSLENAEHMVDVIVATLSEEDPANAGTYAANGETMHDRLHELEEALAAKLSPIHDEPYIVFHDAYQYIEKEHGLTIAGSITVDPEQRPGARRLAELRERVTELGAACVFSEPQFPSDLVETIVEGTPAKTGVLDPLGANLEPGTELYFALMTQMGDAFASCLTQTG